MKKSILEKHKPTEAKALKNKLGERTVRNNKKLISKSKKICNDKLS